MGWNNQIISLLIISASGGFTGFFMYSPAPGAGNLVTSIAPQAGVDPFGNAYPSGVTVGASPDVQANLAIGSNDVGFLQYLLHDARWTNPEMVSSVAPGGGTPFANIALIGPSGTVVGFRDNLVLTLNSSDEVISSANMQTLYDDDSGAAHVFEQVSFQGWATGVCGAITATQPGTGTSQSNIAIPEVWHDLRPLTGSFVGTISGQLPPQYRKCADGDVQIFGHIETPPTTGNYNNVTFATLPANYRPNHTVQVPVTAVADGAATPVLTIASTGTLQLNFLPTSLAQTVIGMDCRFPLDSTGLIQS